MVRSAGPLALDDRVVPVDLVGEAAHVVGELALGDGVGAHGEVLALVVVGGDQRFLLRDQVADAHAGAVRVAQRRGDLAAQGHGVLELGRDGEHRDEVAVLDRALGGVEVEVELLDAARAAVVDALDGGLARLRDGGQAAGVADELAEAGVALELEDRRLVDAAGDGGERADGREVDDVARQQGDVLGLVAGEEKVVEVELGDDAVAALELDAAHRARGRGAAGGEDRVHQGAERAHGVVAGAARVADDEDLHRAQLPHRDQQVEVAEVAATAVRT